jgi:hypothetical protein
MQCYSKVLFKGRVGEYDEGENGGNGGYKKVQPVNEYYRLHFSIGISDSEIRCIIS